MLSTIKQNWFLIGIVVVICMAKIAPQIGAKGGILMPEITVKYIAVFVIFFNSGVSLKSEDLGRALMQVKVHVFVQGFTFLFFPMLIFTLVAFLRIGNFNEHILEGLRILSCMPPPVSSAVILTKAVGGNEGGLHDHKTQVYADFGVLLVTLCKFSVLLIPSKWMRTVFGTILQTTKHSTD